MNLTVEQINNLIDLLKRLKTDQVKLDSMDKLEFNNSQKQQLQNRVGIRGGKLTTNIARRNTLADSRNKLNDKLSELIKEYYL